MDLDINKNVLLAPYTTLGVGGQAAYLVEVGTEAELVAALRFASQTAAPPLILGGGSNVLISDDGYEGLVIINKLAGVSVQERDHVVEVTVGSGILLDEFIAETVAQEWWGLENLSAIPGKVGATPIQNVGAYGVEVSSLITSVRAVHSETLEEKTFPNTECQFGYRDSFFKTEAGRQWCVTQVTFRLSKEATPQLAYKDLQSLQKVYSLTQCDIRDEVIRIRSTKFPDWKKVGTAGSFFKNPIISATHAEHLRAKFPDAPLFVQGDDTYKVSLGWILDHVCGLRGYSEGNIALYQNQALVLVAQEGATATEIETFAKKISTIVFEKTEIKIEWEVTKV